MPRARRWWAVAALGVGLLVALSPAALGHAILVQATPAAKATVDGPDVDVRLRFNSRIDAARSHLALALPGKQERALVLDAQSAPEVLSGKATGLKAGRYRLRWQVLAADGHITRGEVPFRVK